MIIGGIGGVCRIGTQKIGCAHFYLPVLINAVEVPESSIIAPSQITASAFIVNDSGTAVELPEVTNTQASSSTSGTGSCNITLRNVEKWSVAGDTNTDLLRPSTRLVQVVVAVKTPAGTLSGVLFSGNIQNYSETHGQRGSVISLSLRSSNRGLANRPANRLGPETVFRRVEEEFKASGMYLSGQVPAFLYEDRIMTSDIGYSSVSEMIYNLMGRQTEIIARPSGGAILAQKKDNVEASAVFNISDKSSSSMTRSLGSAAGYNRVVCLGVLETVITQTTVQDSADIALRGVVQYPGVVGTTAKPIEESEAEAQQIISEGLRGKLSTQIRLNVFVSAGSVIKFSSDRLFMSAVRCRIGSCNHQLGERTFVTTLSNLAVLDEL